MGCKLSHASDPQQSESAPLKSHESLKATLLEQQRRDHEAKTLVGADPSDFTQGPDAPANQPLSRDLCSRAAAGSDGLPDASSDAAASTAATTVDQDDTGGPREGVKTEVDANAQLPFEEAAWLQNTKKWLADRRVQQEEPWKVETMRWVAARAAASRGVTPRPAGAAQETDFFGCCTSVCLSTKQPPVSALIGDSVC
eukprot:TRINITY_DN74179_c0_g1_i1.p1 TRINITY_DN74179_c0_g1~~TRINITY_DN74179_c0_g1_i1.p1  ORF type:complete len:198 (-),score=37.42 TRINITY_DN74179_c0_g1_i1:194-787(-)